MSSPSEAAKREINDLYPRVKFQRVRELLWERLTEDEQASVIAEFGDEYLERDAAEIWCYLRGVELPQGIVEAAFEVGLLDPGKHKWLLREIGAVPATTTKPDWRDGDLLLDGEVIRRLRTRQPPSNIQWVVEEFQRHDWPSSIDVPSEWIEKTTSDCARSLNRGLKKIRFHSCRGGTGIRWSRR